VSLDDLTCLPQPEEKLPTHQGLNTKNWDSPSAIDWVQMLKVLQDVKCTGSIPLDHVSGHDTEHIPINDNRVVTWKAHFGDLEQHYLVTAKVKVIWVLVEGFKLYWNQVCNS
jgi:nicotinamide/nicotinate riboside kinase